MPRHKNRLQIASVRRLFLFSANDQSKGLNEVQIRVWIQLKYINKAIEVLERQRCFIIIL